VATKLRGSLGAGVDEGCFDGEAQVTLSVDTYETIEEPLWFGPNGRPLIGWLTRPVGGLARGAVLCAPPIGREARAGRRAMRSLAKALAARGFVTLRFDYDGTGDSSGGFNDVGRDQLWIESVVEATNYLRSLGLKSVSAVGMRLGATLIGVAADRHQLDLSSVVLWDPCESGQSFLRELNALEALRRDDFRIVAGAPVETSEFVFSTRAAEEIRRVVLSKTTSTSFGERTLIMSRSDRATPKRLRTHLTGEGVEWQSTNQQASLLDLDPMWALLPEHTMDRIVTWFCSPDSTMTPFKVIHLPKSAAVATEPGRLAVHERIVEFGPERLFGIVTEPVGDIQGPLVVMFNVANEEHTGPSRLWVELSRRWAGYGLRSVRFDVRGLGDSPWLTQPLNTEFYFESWLEDIMEVARELNPDDVSNAVFIGLCSGAYWAVEAALELQARGVCAINPPVYIDYLHSVRKLETSRRPLLQRVGSRLKQVAQHQWVTAVAWHVTRVFLPPAISVDLLEKLDHDKIDVLLLYGVEEVWPYKGVPFFRSIDFRRVLRTSGRHIEFVPGLDHGMHFADGRNRAVDILDRHVLEHFGGVTGSIESGSIFTEES
jgi:pimeloyl-ACP methyl ester carboxylesterase